MSLSGRRPRPPSSADKKKAAPEGAACLTMQVTQAATVRSKASSRSRPSPPQEKVASDQARSGVSIASFLFALPDHAAASADAVAVMHVLVVSPEG